MKLFRGLWLLVFLQAGDLLYHIILQKTLKGVESHLTYFPRPCLVLRNVRMSTIDLEEMTLQRQWNSLRKLDFKVRNFILHSDLKISKAKGILSLDYLLDPRHIEMESGEFFDILSKNLSVPHLRGEGRYEISKKFLSFQLETSNFIFQSVSLGSLGVKGKLLGSLGDQKGEVICAVEGIKPLINRFKNPLLSALLLLESLPRDEKGRTQLHLTLKNGTIFYGPLPISRIFFS